VLHPTSIVFNNIAHEVNLSEQSQGSYLFNDLPNSITLKHGQTEETVFIDTQSINKQILSVHLGSTEIRTIRVEVAKIKSPLSIEHVIQDGAYTLVKQTDSQDPNSYTKLEKTDSSIALEAKHGSLEATFYKDNLYHQGSYILFANASYTSGLPVNFYVDNPSENKPELDTKFSKKAQQNVIVVPKTEDYFTGYGFHFIVKSIGHETAKSTLESIDLYPFPSATIKGIILRKETSNLPETGEKLPVSFRKLNGALYQTDTDINEGYLVFSQSYDPGWKAYSLATGNWQLATGLKEFFPFIFGKELQNHVLVNNWENGWLLDNQDKSGRDKTIVIVYLPQYLEYIGFGVLGITAVLLAVTTIFKKVSS
jgi:hypothetical protein